MFIIRCQDWQAFAKAQEGTASDPEYQALLAQVLTKMKLEGRNVVMGYEL